MKNALILALCLACLALSPVLAQVIPGTGTEATEQAEETVSADPLGRSTPRGMVNGLIEALADNDYEAAMAYLDLSRVPEPARVRQGPLLAQALQRALDQSGGILPTYRLSTQEQGLAGDGLPEGVDAFATVQDDTGLRDLLAARTQSLDGRLIWLVTPDTLTFVSDVASVQAVSLVDRLTPSAFSDQRLFGAPLFHWLALLILAIFCFAVGRGVTRVLLALLSRLSGGLKTDRAKAVVAAILRPLAVITALLLFSALQRLFGISFVARSTIAPGVEILMWLALVWLLWRAIDAASSATLASMSRRGRLGALSVVNLVRRALKFILLMALAIASANALGLNLTGWLAAFGLGGLAFALGAQKTIEHFVGSLSLIADQPVRVGDFCQVDGITGTVEDIGIRSTRLRTLSNTLVTIPNGTMSGAVIENYAGRERFLYRHTIGLTYDATREQIRAILWRLRGLFDGSDAVERDTLRINFLGFGASSLDIEIYCYIEAESYPEFLNVQEELNLGIMEAMEECGTEFAFPSRTVYLAGGEQKDGGAT